MHHCQSRSGSFSLVFSSCRMRRKDKEWAKQRKYPLDKKEFRNLKTGTSFRSIADCNGSFFEYTLAVLLFSR